MTTHEADRSADHDSVEENEELGVSDDQTDERHHRETGTDADVAGADTQEPVEDEPETSWSRERDGVAVDTDEAEGAEPELVDVDEAERSTEPELADEPDGTGAAAAHTLGSDPLQKLAPVGTDAALDPGTGSYEDRWGAVQAGFIDDPRRTVETAGALVVEIWDETVRAITDEREGVDRRWQGTESSTDDLRVAMQDYRDLYARFMRFRSS